jgi:hypothetical protein
VKNDFHLALGLYKDFEQITGRKVINEGSGVKAEQNFGWMQVVRGIEGYPKVCKWSTV